jgi:hypothetical protein
LRYQWIFVFFFFWECLQQTSFFWKTSILQASALHWRQMQSVKKYESRLIEGAFGQLEEMLFRAAAPKSSLELSVPQRDTQIQRASTTKTMSSDESPGTVEYEINISYISTSSLLYTVCTSGQPLKIFSYATHNHVHSTKHNLPSPSCNHFFPLT